jgi:hypothetical protein
LRFFEPPLNDQIMSPEWTHQLKHLIRGPLLESVDSQSICFRAILGDLQPRFIPKGQIGRGYRAVARNGRILLASTQPLDQLIGREADIRLQPWRKVILPGEKPEIFGVLFCVQGSEDSSYLNRSQKHEIFHVRLSDDAASAEITLDVGGGSTLVLERTNREIHQSGKKKEAGLPFRVSRW